MPVCRASPIRSMERRASHEIVAIHPCHSCVGCHGAPERLERSRRRCGRGGPRPCREGQQQFRVAVVRTPSRRRRQFVFFALQHFVGAQHDAGWRRRRDSNPACPDAGANRPGSRSGAIDRRVPKPDSRRRRRSRTAFRQLALGSRWVCAAQALYATHEQRVWRRPSNGRFQKRRRSGARANQSLGGKGNQGKDQGLDPAGRDQRLHPARAGQRHLLQGRLGCAIRREFDPRSALHTRQRRGDQSPDHVSNRRIRPGRGRRLHGARNALQRRSARIDGHSAQVQRWFGKTGRKTDAGQSGSAGHRDGDQKGLCHAAEV
ncbi:MAG: hypothetical protein BWZ10_03071 [candidate division BRC1 bacterium ADurb.BinA364]|nr:MAG: hypothetical protein BWZ10_03071 [candidate division BRC1 bacterium ADurb.BinA364]